MWTANVATVSRFITVALATILISLPLSASPPRTAPVAWANARQGLKIRVGSSAESGGARLVATADPDVALKARPRATTGSEQPPSTGAQQRALAPEIPSRTERATVVVPADARISPSLLAKITKPVDASKLEVVFAPQESLLVLQQGERRVAVPLIVVGANGPVSSRVIQFVGITTESLYKSWNVPAEVVVDAAKNVVKFKGADGQAATFAFSEIPELPPEGVTILRLDSDLPLASM